MKKLTDQEKINLAGDLHAYGGALLFAGGAYWAWPPLGLIVLGLFLAWLGIFWRRKAR